MSIKNDELESTHELLNKWEEIRVLIESMDIDVRKNATKGNAAAGIRARRGLRLLKKTAHDLLMMSMKEDRGDKKDEE
jgi:hypothetical protein